MFLLTEVYQLRTWFLCLKAGPEKGSGSLGSWTPLYWLKPTAKQSSLMNTQQHNNNIDKINLSPVTKTFSLGRGGTKQCLSPLHKVLVANQTLGSSKFTVGDQWIQELTEQEWRVAGGSVGTQKQPHWEVFTQNVWGLPHSCIHGLLLPCLSQPIDPSCPIPRAKPWGHIQLGQNYIQLNGRKGWIFRWGSDDTL